MSTVRTVFSNQSDVAHFAGHPTASFLPVSVGKDAKQLFAALKELPNLQGLNFRVEEDASDKYWSDLPALKKLAHFNWWSGLINAELLGTMSEMESLRSLLFQGSSVLAEDSPEGLKQLARLERLTLRAQEELCSDDLRAALRSLQHLKEWPELENAFQQRASMRLATTDSGG